MKENIKILLVDDETHLAEPLTRLIQRNLGNSSAVIWALDPKIALRILREEGPFQVVITDGCFPGKMSGADLMRSIRRGKTEDGNRGTPRNTFIILFSVWPADCYDEERSVETFDLVLAKMNLEWREKLLEAIGNRFKSVVSK